MAQAYARLLTAAPVRARTADQPDRVVRAVRTGGDYARIDHVGRLRSRPGAVGGRRTPSPGASAVRHHRRVFRAAVLRLAGRVPASARTMPASPADSSPPR